MERLTVREGRVVASLVEKQLTIPQHYPLTLNALVAACNQSSSRDPVTDYGEAEVLEAVESLKAKRLVRSVLPSHGRSAVRYRQVLDETLGLDAPQLAVLAVLELRGPQTAAELRARTERLAAFDQVDHELDLLASRDHPLVERLARRPRQKEERWASLLSDPSSGRPAVQGQQRCQDDPVRETRSSAAPVESAVSADGGLRADVDGLRRDLDAVRDDVGSLRAGLGDLRRDLDELRTNLGG